MGGFDDLLGEADVFLEGVMGSVKHDRGKAGLDTFHRHLKTAAVIQVKCHRHARLFGSDLSHRHHIFKPHITHGPFTDTENKGGFLLLRRSGDALDKLQVVHIELPHRKTFFFGAGEKLGHRYQ